MSRGLTAGSRGALGLGIVVLTFVVFLPAYAYDYTRHDGTVWDDDDHFLEDPLIRAEDGWWRIWLDPQPGIVGVAGGSTVWNYWPLTRTSFWVERHLWGVDERERPNLLASHVTNVALHALNALLVLLVLRQLRLPGAELAALLFAVHPVTVESVAWLTERKAVLSTTLFGVSLVGWLRFEDTGRARWYAFTSGAFLLALMSKTSTVMFPVVLVLIHLFRGQPWTSRRILRLAPFFAMSLVAGITSIVFENFFIGSEGDAWSVGLGERLAAAGMIVWFYVGKLLLPLGLSFNYPRWQIDPAYWVSYLPSVALVAAAFVLWRFRKGWARPWILGLGSFVASLFPVLGFFDIYGMRYAHVADHWVYLPCIPVLALVAGLVASFPDWISRSRPGSLGTARIGVGAFAILAVGALGWLTWQQSGAYVDAETLWEHTLEREPDSFIAHNNLGTRRLAEGRHDDAIAHFRRAIEVAPRVAEAHLNLGNAINASTGDLARAEPHWVRASELDPGQAQALYNLAALRLQQGRLAEAEGLLRRALEARPTYERAFLRLLWLFRQQGRPQAIEPHREAAREVLEARGEGGRSVALGIWAAMAVALAACAAVGVLEARRPAAGPGSV